MDIKIHGSQNEKYIIITTQANECHTKMRYRDIDWLRTMCVLLVVVGHSMGSIQMLLKGQDTDPAMEQCFHVPILFMLSGEVAVLTRRLFEDSSVRSALAWYTRNVVIHKGRRLIFPYFCVGFLLIDKIGDWVAGKFTLGFLHVMLHVWLARVSWFLLALYCVYLLNGWNLGKIPWGTTAMAVIMALGVIVPWSLQFPVGGSVTAAVTSLTLLFPYFVMECTPNPHGTFLTVAATFSSSVALHVYWQSLDMQPYWVFNFVRCNHFFVVGTQVPSMMTLHTKWIWPPVLFFAAIVFASSVEPSWHADYWAALGRALYTWSWLVILRSAAKGLCTHSDDEHQGKLEILLHDSGMFIYLLHTPLVHCVKWLLLDYVHPYLIVLLCLVIVVPICILLYWLSQKCQDRFYRLHAALPPSSVDLSEICVPPGRG